jgi:hypothetical protein
LDDEPTHQLHDCALDQVGVFVIHLDLVVEVHLPVITVEEEELDDRAT